MRSVLALPLLAVGLLLAAGTVSFAGEGKSIESPIARLAALSKLPETLATLGQDQRLVQFARGAVQLRPAPEWRIAEVPYERNLALVLTSSELPDSLPELQDGVWLTYAQLKPDVSQAGRSQTAAEELAARIRQLYPKAKLSPPTTQIIADCPALLQEFRLAAEPSLFAAPRMKQSQQEVEPPSSRRGWHAYVATESGQVELHVIGSQADPMAEAQIGKLLATLNLSTPEPYTPEIPANLLDAETTMGSWKSARALLEIRPDGTLCLTSDRKKAYQLDRQGLVDYEKPQQVLEGEFAAEDDLIRIRWKDGSLLNVRWRLEDNELLITDHHGRVRRLTRLVR